MFASVYFLKQIIKKNLKNVFLKFCLRFRILYKGCSKSIRKVYIKNAIGKNQENSALQAIYQNVESSTKQAFIKLDDSSEAEWKAIFEYCVR